jgi:hypothetical protein
MSTKEIFFRFFNTHPFGIPAPLKWGVLYFTVTFLAAFTAAIVDPERVDLYAGLIAPLWLPFIVGFVLLGSGKPIPFGAMSDWLKGYMALHGPRAWFDKLHPDERHEAYRCAARLMPRQYERVRQWLRRRYNKAELQGDRATSYQVLGILNDVEWFKP